MCGNKSAPIIRSQKRNYQARCLVRARLQPCRKCRNIHTALAAEVLFRACSHTAFSPARRSGLAIAPLKRYSSPDRNPSRVSYMVHLHQWRLERDLKRLASCQTTAAPHSTASSKNKAFEQKSKRSPSSACSLGSSSMPCVVNKRPSRPWPDSYAPAVRNWTGCLILKIYPSASAPSPEQPEFSASA